MCRTGFKVLFALLATMPAVAAPITDDMTLVEAIAAARDAGVEVVYSSEYVQEWMRVREAPEAADPREALRQALAAYGLDLAAGPSGRWLVVRRAAAEADQPPPSPMQPGRAEPEAAAPRIDEIVIVGSRHALFDSVGTSDQLMSGDDIRRMPHMADDTFRALHRLPGAAANDFQAPFNLRGGAADEIKVSLDGFEIYEPFHMRTLFRPLSIIDPGIIDRAEVLSGGFTAEHGNFMSGVIDMRSERPQGEALHEVGISFVSAFARSRSEFADGRGSYFIAARRGYLDLLADSIVDDDEELEPRYNDVYGKLSWSIADSTELVLQTLIADDEVSFVDPGDGEDFGENSSLRYVWLSAELEPRPGLLSRAILFTGDVDSTEAGSQTNPPVELVSRFYDRRTTVSGIREDLTWVVSDDQLFKAGVRYRWLDGDFDYRLDATRRSDFVNNGAPFITRRNLRFSIDGNDASVYAAWRRRAGRQWTYELGLRYDYQDYVSSGTDSQLSPRANLLYAIGDRTELRLAWGEFSQAQDIQDIDIPDGDTTVYPAQAAEHTIAGVRHRFGSGLRLQADLYHKRYSDLKPRYENLLDVYEFAPESNFDRVRIAPRSARAYGAEFTLQGADVGNLDWWINYSWSRADDRVDGEYVPRSWDQRHAATASVAWQGEKWSASVVARYHSGWPRTPLEVEPLLDGSGAIIGIVSDLEARNSRKFDDYTRVDVRVSRRVDFDRSTLEWYFEIFNLFDSENQCCTSNHVLSIGSSVSVSPVVDDFLPRFPSFGFVWRFGPGA